MTFEIYFEHIPYIARENFLTACGRYDYILSDIFTIRREQELAKFNCKRFRNHQDELVYEFESEAHYNWFILRWS